MQVFFIVPLRMEELDGIYRFLMTTVRKTYRTDVEAQGAGVAHVAAAQSAVRTG